MKFPKYGKSLNSCSKPPTRKGIWHTHPTYWIPVLTVEPSDLIGKVPMRLKRTNVLGQTSIYPLVITTMAIEWKMYNNFQCFMVINHDIINAIENPSFNVLIEFLWENPGKSPLPCWITRGYCTHSLRLRTVHHIKLARNIQFVAPRVARWIQSTPTINGHDSGTDLLEVPIIYKAYFLGLCKGISPQRMALYGTVPPF